MDKRSYRRYPVWFPVTLLVGDGAPGAHVPHLEVWAICRDVSPSGILVSTVTAIEPGARLTVRFRVRPGGKEHVFEATVVRQLSNRDELLLAFPHRVALEFAKPEPELLDELSRHATTMIG